MQELIAGLEKFNFAFEKDVEGQRGSQILPFQGMDKSGAAVCDFFIQGICKKGECSNKDCPFLHIDPASKIKDCPWYDRGFCKHGPACKHRHTRRVMCTNYLVGFCPEGPSCKYVHPKVDLIIYSPDHIKNAAAPQRVQVPSLPCDPEPTLKPPALILELPHLSHLTVLTMMHERFRKMQENVCGGLRPLEQVTCFKCGERGHYANKCSKNRYALLLRK
ncbi:putative cleavage and polyadenylation specificity factor subunit 4-like protein isoform X2 [Dendrobates tinctorius]|uniref:putative cleavage and polyadenylation specificity factor subunit 4-like protein isoform X2 n=1 Tax=Dendrobates tinctorius TaxID=92724 RepID=UPI003CCA69D0